MLFSISSALPVAQSNVVAPADKVTDDKIATFSDIKANNGPNIDPNSVPKPPAEKQVVPASGDDSIASYSN
ncbi:hypothetical protein HK096_007942 [Nowakowskiella sp. JEL0078]|nr:hypothetical protein HK096_007942 [Nowakowskiella sp. JEL0078]